MIVKKSKRVIRTKEEKKRFFKRRFAENILGTCMASPPFIGFALFSLIPMIFSLYLSFMELHSVVISLAEPVGFSNYLRVLQDETTYQALANTAVYCVNVILCLIVSVFLANLLDTKHIIGKKFVRIIYFLPSVAPSVAATVMWAWIFNENYGVINQFLDFVGMNRFLPYTNPDHFLPGAWIIRLWISGTNIVLLQSAFANVNRTLQESARIDGATERQVFWKITLPQVSPTVFYVFIMNIVAAAQEVGTLQVFAGGTVGPGGKALVVAYYLQRMIGIEIQTKGYGMASAMSWLYSIVLIAFTRICFKISDKVVSYD